MSGTRLRSSVALLALAACAWSDAAGDPLHPGDFAKQMLQAIDRGQVICFG